MGEAAATALRVSRQALHPPAPPEPGQWGRRPQGPTVLGWLRAYSVLQPHGRPAMDRP